MVPGSNRYQRAGFAATGAGDLDGSDGLQSRPGMDLILAHDRSLAAESLNDRADIGADLGAGQQDRRISGQGGALEGVAHGPDEVLQAGGRHGQLLLFARANQGFGEGVFPLARHGDDGQGAFIVAVGEGQLAGKA